jgi:hypothetical protein
MHYEKFTAVIWLQISGSLVYGDNKAFRRDNDLLVSVQYLNISEHYSNAIDSAAQMEVYL